MNLAPADVRKQGPIYDLPIAVAILVASRQVPDRFGEMALLGELSLDGHLRHVNGVLPLVSMCLDEGIGTAVVPPQDVAEARLAESVDVRGLSTLADVKAEPGKWTAETNGAAPSASPDAGFDLAVVQVQEHVKPALEAAAAGGEDRDGTQAATARQRSDCEAFATAQGWTVEDVFEDVDVSAYQRTAKRPEFERMLEAVRSDAIEGVLAWKLDRITRRQRDLVRLDEACEDAGGFIATVTDGVDTRTPTGRFVSELMVAQARMESENTALRVRRVHAERAAQGKPNPGGRRPYGYTMQRDEIIEPEAELIREAARRILTGESVRGLIKDWYARGVRTADGNVWAATTLRRTLISPTLSGQREYNGTITPGTWPPILDPTETTRLRAILCDPRRVHRAHAPRSYLLSGGVARCGRCGHPLIVRPGYKAKRRYVCARRPGAPSCGRLARQAEPVEGHVAAMIFEALRGVDVARFLPDEGADSEGVAEQVRADEQALETLAADFYAEDGLTRAEFNAARSRLLARLEDNRRQLARRASGPLQAALDAGEALEQRWATETLEWRIAVVGTLIESVTIQPALRGRAQFDADAIEVAWKVSRACNCLHTSMNLVASRGVDLVDAGLDDGHDNLPGELVGRRPVAIRVLGRRLPDVPEEGVLPAGVELGRPVAC